MTIRPRISEIDSSGVSQLDIAQFFEADQEYSIPRLESYSGSGKNQQSEILTSIGNRIVAATGEGVWAGVGRPQQSKERLLMRDLLQVKMNWEIL